MRKGKGSFADLAVRYATQVVAGEIAACWQIRSSCQRFLDDVGGEVWTLDAAKVERVCLFAQTFPYLEGVLALKKLRLRLEPWQVWILAALFGVVDEFGLRKHREAFIEIPRKNGKSTFAAVIALYMLVADYEQRPQVFIGATKLKQADYCFQPAREMATRSPGFLGHYGARVLKRRIELPDGGYLEPMIGDPPDGSNPSLAVLDEAHEHHSFARQRETMRTGMGARTQPLLLTITTAGFNEAGDCRALQAQCEQILAGELTDQRRFSAIYTLDPGDDWRDFNAWLKANPNVGVSFTVERLRELHRTALSVPSEKPGLLTKHCNVWQSSSAAWVSMAEWDRNADAPPLQDIINQNHRAWIGVDLSKIMDTTAIGLLVDLPVNGQPRQCFYPFMFLPEMALERQARNAAAYTEWAEAGYLKLTDDDATDFAAVEDKLRELCQQFNVQGIAFDQWQAAMMTQRLGGEGLPVLTYPQTIPNLHPPMSRFEQLLALGQLRHDGNKMMRWQTSNVVAKHHNEFIKPAKPPRRPDAKIDGFVALVMALGIAGVEQAKPAEVWMDLLD